MIVCLTEIAATLIEGATTMHHAFKMNSRSNMQSVINLLLKETFQDEVSLFVCDEISMVLPALFVDMNEKCKAMYDPTKAFGGLDVILSGDFLQMPPVGNKSICKSLYITTEKTDTECRLLTEKFKVYHIEEQCRSKCEVHKKDLLKFRKLPENYPTKSKWTKEEKEKYKLIDDELMDHITKVINTADVMECAGEGTGWEEDPIVTNNNRDRNFINRCRAKIFAEKNNEIVVK